MLHDILGPDVSQWDESALKKWAHHKVEFFKLDRKAMNSRVTPNVRSMRDAIPTVGMLNLDDLSMRYKRAVIPRDAYQEKPHGNKGDDDEEDDVDDDEDDDDDDDDDEEEEDGDEGEWQEGVTGE